MIDHEREQYEALIDSLVELLQAKTELIEELERELLETCGILRPN